MTEECKSGSISFIREKSENDIYTYKITDNGKERPMTKEEIKWFEDMEKIRKNPRKAVKEWLEKKK